jgi:hypothetical protein
VLGHLIKIARPMTLSGLKADLGISHTAAKNACDALLERGDIEPADVFTKRGSFPGVRALLTNVGQPRTSQDF